MELVKGVPITEYCDQQRLATRDRLKLFVDVCHAVQHAHQKGIIHRDLKPTNVLVTVQDGRALVKVIDFGIAKAMGQQLTDRTLFTGFAQLIGTPLYMSPEQAALSAVDVDTRSDVYSLGVLLYELLTGTTPFDKERLSNLSYDELRRIIREDEPPRPSARISTLAVDTRSTIASRQQIEPHTLGTQLRGELDWIVMRALEKDRNRRYESASALAADVERYLNDEAVQACPPSAWYRVSKFSRRHRTMIVGGVVVTVVLIAGVAGTLWEAMRAADEARIARANSERADANLKLAITAVDEMYTDVAETTLRMTPGVEKFRQRVLERALEFYLAFAKANADSDLKHETAMAWRRVGEVYHRLEQNDRAQDSLLTAIGLLQALVDDEPDQPAYQRDLGSTYWFLSKPLEVCGQFEQSAMYCRKALEIQQELHVRFPESLDDQTALATTYHQLGHVLQDSEQSIAAFQESTNLFKDLHERIPTEPHYVRQLAHDYSHVAKLLQDQGNLGEAEQTYLRAIELLERVDGPPHADVIDSYGAILGGVYRNWGVLLRETERLNDAAAAHGQAVRLLGELASAFPTVPHYRCQLGLSQMELGKTHSAANRYPEAKEQLDAADANFKKLETDFPENSTYSQYHREVETLLESLRQTTSSSSN